MLEGWPGAPSFRRSCERLEAIGWGFCLVWLITLQRDLCPCDFVTYRGIPEIEDEVVVSSLVADLKKQLSVASSQLPAHKGLS